MKGNGDAYQIWNKDQIIATPNSTKLGHPSGVRPPVSDSAIIWCAFLMVLELEPEEAVSETVLRVSFVFI
jgi:hypothetical protein